MLSWNWSLEVSHSIDVEGIYQEILNEILRHPSMSGHFPHPLCFQTLRIPSRSQYIALAFPPLRCFVWRTPLHIYYYYGSHSLLQNLITFSALQHSHMNIVNCMQDSSNFIPNWSFFHLRHSAFINYSIFFCTKPGPEIDSQDTGSYTLLIFVYRYMEDGRSSFKIVAGKPTWRRPLGRPRHRWEECWKGPWRDRYQCRELG